MGAIPLRKQENDKPEARAELFVVPDGAEPASDQLEQGWRSYVSGMIASEISRMTRYADRLIQWAPLSNDKGLIFRLVDAPEKTVANSIEELPEIPDTLADRTVVLVRGNLNHDYDIQKSLQSLGRKLSRSSRVVLVLYNAYYRWLYQLANRLGIRKGPEPDTFVTFTDLENLAKISGFEVVRSRPVAYVPFRLWGLGTLLNRVLPAIPGLRWFGLASVVVLRPARASTEKPSLSIVIPARNEKGNIENALRRMPDFDGAKKEIIFVEGNSTDDTWEEIQRVVAEYGDRFELSAYKQPGKGKSDAVRLGFAKAKNDLLVILDADLTMPPELLERYYRAFVEGHADFVNGSRLVYPMEGEAMRFLNRLGNKFFAKALSFVLDCRIGDSLCGTKLVTRYDYERFCRWREDFGDVDPFGDFELLFPAAELGLGIVDIPIRYLDRTYGSTNISRFRHGAMLFRMTWIGLLRIKLGQLGARTCRP